MFSKLISTCRKQHFEPQLFSFWKILKKMRFFSDYQWKLFGWCPEATSYSSIGTIAKNFLLKNFRQTFFFRLWGKFISDLSCPGNNEMSCHNVFCFRNRVKSHSYPKIRKPLTESFLFQIFWRSLEMWSNFVIVNFLLMEKG